MAENRKRVVLGFNQKFEIIKRLKNIKLLLIFLRLGEQQ